MRTISLEEETLSVNPRKQTTHLKLETPGYVPSLDGIRAIAVLLVMFGHLNLIRLGGLGVDIFFVLSGYLISAILLSEFRAHGRISLKKFYARRALRLLPALSLLLLALNIFVVIRHREQATTIQWQSLAALFYLANWLRAFGHDLGVLGHLWSLSIEEQFYLLWPVTLVLLLRLKLSATRLAALVISVALVIPFYRLFLWDGIQSFDRIYNGLDTRADALLIGCALGISGFRLLPRRVLSVLGVLAVPFLAYVMVFGYPVKFQVTFGGTLFALGVAAVLAATLSNPGSLLVKLLEIRPLVWTGRLSYGLYLWHFPVFAIGWLPNLKPALALPIKIFVTFVCATLSYYIVERPFLTLKEKFGVTKGSARAEGIRK